MIDTSTSQLSIRRQCELPGLNRSRYYQPGQETIENLRLMRWIDEQYIKPPYSGSRRMAIVLAATTFIHGLALEEVSIGDLDV